MPSSTIHSPLLRAIALGLVAAAVATGPGCKNPDAPRPESKVLTPTAQEPKPGNIDDQPGSYPPPKDNPASPLPAKGESTGENPVNIPVRPD
ncbi:MAG TPA: hypothetical protein VHC95_04610 [Opitutales bacterium]|nr:hypothetical protein [Opitutales bacterium]